MQRRLRRMQRATGRYSHLAFAGVLVALQLVPAAALAADAAVDITSTLTPAELTITPGTTVTWTNSDDETHRVRSESGPTEFDSGNLDPGESFSFTFSTEGTYTYIDDRDKDNSSYFGSVVVSSAASDPDPDPVEPPPPPPTAGDVSIVDRSFSPTTIEVGLGGSVTWANNDTEEHTVTATDSSWDSGIFDTGGTYTRTFATAGSFAYFCLIHPDMTGTVIVTGAGGDPIPPPVEPPPPADEPVAPPPAPTGPGAVTIVDFDFSPSGLTVSAGSSVTWTNTGAAPHTVTAEDGSSDSGFLSSGDSYTQSFAAAGSFNYFCTLHPAMTGTITVTGADGAAPPASSDPPAEDNPTADPAPVSGSGDVNVVDNAFGPASITVPAGSTLSWLNKGSLPHTVTARNGAFDSGILVSGGRYSRTFATPGTYSYFCTIHPEMTGSVLVTGADGEIPAEEGLDDAANASGLGGAAPTGPASVAIVDNDYDPGSLTVGVGQTVTFTNTGLIPHTVTDRADTFDSGFLMSGDTYRLTPTEVGTIAYFCTIHPEMSGMIIVSEDIAVDNGEGSDGGLPSTGSVGAGAGDGDESLEVSQSVRIIDNDFDPTTVTVEAGTAVMWRNVGQLPHTVTDRASSFDSGILENGGTFVQQFDATGVFEYFCTLHPDMVATVEVIAPQDVDAVALVSRAPVAPAVAYILAGGFVVAMAVFVVGLGRFLRTAEEAH